MAAKSVIITDYTTQLPGKVDPENPTIYIFPQIKSVNTHGTTTFWRIMVRIVVDPGTPAERFVQITPEWFNPSHAPAGHFGWIKVISKTGDDGKIRDVVPDIVRQGKNIGKANATSPFTQALRDALSKHNLQCKKVTPAANGDEGELELFPPMLAQKREGHVIDFTEDVYEQKKYNGVRSPSTRVWVEHRTVDGKTAPHYHTHPVPDVVPSIIMYSRRRNIYPEFDEIKVEILQIMTFFDTWVAGNPAKYAGRLFLDGEIYKHGVALQDIAGIARKEGKRIALQYYIYDCFVPEHPSLLYSERKAFLDAVEAHFNGSLKHIVFAPTVIVKTEAEMVAAYQQYMKEGYEGAIVRINRPYHYSYNDYHCDSLLKFKPLFDAEFKVVGYTNGERGKNENTLLMVCETATGVKFNVSLKNFTIPKSKAKYTEMGTKEANGKTVFENQYLGKMMTVHYEELSTDGVPVRANTELYIREDL